MTKFFKKLDKLDKLLVVVVSAGLVFQAVNILIDIFTESTFNLYSLTSFMWNGLALLLLVDLLVMQFMYASLSDLMDDIYNKLKEASDKLEDKDA